MRKVLNHIVTAELISLKPGIDIICNLKYHTGYFIQVLVSKSCNSKNPKEGKISLGFSREKIAEGKDNR